MEKVIATHNGKFHEDDVFAISILKLIYPKIKIIRTREENKIKKADFRIDVGRKYDPQTGDYDHHQEIFKLKRKNKIPYASAGLVWKHFGRRLVKNKEAFEHIDKILMQAIDARDNGVEIYSFRDIKPYTLNDCFKSFMPNWDEKKDYTHSFRKAISISISILKREIKKANSLSEGEKIVRNAIKKSSRDFIVLPKGRLPWEEILIDESSAKFLIWPFSEKSWVSMGVPKKKGSFERRALFPKRWADSEKDLADKTGVKEATFCHKHRFIVSAKTKKGVIELTKLALKKLK